MAIEEGRAASKSSHQTFGYFLSTSQQEVSADIIFKIQLLEIFTQKQKEQRQKQLKMSLFSDVFSLPVHF